MTRSGFKPILPGSVTYNLRVLHASIPAGRHSPRAARNSDLLNAYLKALHDVGWPLRAMGDALGLGRQRILQRIAKAPELDVRPFFEVPIVPVAPPRPMSSRKAPKMSPPLPEREAQELQALYRACGFINGSTKADDPRRAWAHMLNERIMELIGAGYSRYRIAQALDISPGAVRARLGRYGYQPLSPSQAHHAIKSRQAS